jgi:hypothetical protein
MSTDLIQRAPGQLTRRQERQLAAHLMRAQVPAQVAAAKIEAAAFATHVALSHAGMLSATEARLITLAPTGEPRYRAICDAFAGYACQEISLLAFK